MAQANRQTDIHSSGIPEEQARKLFAEHQRVLASSAASGTVDDASLVLANTASLVGEEFDATLLAPLKLETTKAAFAAAVAKQFQTSPQFFTELNRMFTSKKASDRRTSGNVICWTDYGLEQFRAFYTNYTEQQAGNEVDELLPRLEHATADIVHDIGDPISPRLIPTTLRTAAARERKVPTPKPGEIEAYKQGTLKLTGLANRDGLPTEKIYLTKAAGAAEDKSDEALVKIAQEFEKSVAKTASQNSKPHTLRIGKTAEYIDFAALGLTASATEYIAAARQAFEVAVLKEAGEKSLGTRELGAMIYGVKGQKSVKSLAWTEQGLHKFQLFLPGFVEEMQRLHPPEPKERTLGRAARLVGGQGEGADIEDSDFETRIVRRGSSAGKPRKAYSTAREATHVHEVGIIDHLSGDVYPFDESKHLTLEQVTAELSKRHNYSYSNNQISARINNILRDYKERSEKPGFAALPRDLYVCKAGTAEKFEIFYTQEALKMLTKSLIDFPPQEVIIDKSLSAGEGIDAARVADELGVPRDQFIPDLLELAETLPLHLRRGVRVTIAPDVLNELKEQGIIDGNGVHFDRAAHAYSGENILRQIRDHFTSGALDPFVFNMLKDEYHDLGHAVLPLQNIVFNNSGRPSGGPALAGYDFRDCDLSNSDFSFCDISNAHMDGSTQLADTIIDSSTKANEEQRALFRSQQQGIAKS